MSRAAAKIFVEQSHRAIKLTGRFSVLLSGGNTPMATYECLAKDPFKNQVDWSKVNIFWGDERCVEPTDPRSNYLMASESLLSHVSIPPSQIYPMFCSKDPYEAAISYEKLLKNYFGLSLPCFDLTFLGLGEDGHIASLFPESEVLKEKEHWVRVVKNESDNFLRLTLTLPILNRSKIIVFLVTGEKKKQILEKVLAHESTDQFPAQLIQPINGKLIWLVD